MKVKLEKEDAKFKPFSITITFETMLELSCLVSLIRSTGTLHDLYIKLNEKYIYLNKG